jgi:hypothetical protein
MIWRVGTTRWTNSSRDPREVPPSRGARLALLSAYAEPGFSSKLRDFCTARHVLPVEIRLRS